MRGLRAKPTLRLEPIISIQRYERLQNTLDVVDRAGVYNIKIECADRRTLQDRAHAAYNDEVNRVLI